MGRIPRPLAILTLVAFLGQLIGCSVHTPGRLPGGVQDPARAADEAAVVTAGASVRVTLRDGTVVGGQVVRVSADALVLADEEAFGSGTRTISAGKIRALEVVEAAPSGKTVVLAFGGVLAAAAIFFAVAFAHSDWPPE